MPISRTALAGAPPHSEWSIAPSVSAARAPSAAMRSCRESRQNSCRRRRKAGRRAWLLTQTMQASATASPSAPLSMPRSTAPCANAPPAAFVAAKARQWTASLWRPAVRSGATRAITMSTALTASARRALFVDWARHARLPCSTIRSTSAATHSATRLSRRSTASSASARAAGFAPPRPRSKRRPLREGRRAPRTRPLECGTLTWRSARTSARPSTAPTTASCASAKGAPCVPASRR
mmetsp:Transcript_57431/g.131847  ORF Transcript_57431/g.131847 Transcript_57431/m.131847 type:complete len:237 (-) Transcript_57431:2973-3683(-)